MNRIVIKVGTNLLTQEDGTLDRNNLVQIIDQVAYIITTYKCNVCIVSSGAIACGNKILNQTKQTIADKQASASVGQILLMSEYRTFFKEHHHTIGQILLTKQELTDQDEKENIHNTIETLFNHSIIPIVNANDSVSTLQIESGDNDEIAALLSILIEADTLILLTNTDGVYSDNPSESEEAKLISRIDNVDNAILKIAKGPENSKSRGGMKSKVVAADTAQRSGINVYIANGRQPDAILDIFTEKSTGTFFPKREL